jgi:hypothetical protein
MCDKNKCEVDTFKVKAPVDKAVCLEQASLAYNMYVLEAKNGNEGTADLWMGIANLLFHLHNGSYTLTQTLAKPNRGVY